MENVYVFLADGFEEIEGLTVVDILRRAGVETRMVSIMGREMVTGAHGIQLKADALFEQVVFEQGDTLVLPGGMPGTLHLGEYKPLTDLLLRWNAKGGRIAAICAAPSVLGDLGILEGKEAVCYPGFEGRLKGATIGERSVAVSQNVITSRGMGTAIDFATALVEEFQGAEAAEKMKKSIIYGLFS